MSIASDVRGPASALEWAVDVALLALLVFALPLVVLLLGLPIALLIRGLIEVARAF